VRLSTDARGFGGGGGVGLLYHIAPQFDFLGEANFGILGFTDFDLDDDLGAGSATTGWDLGIRLGVRTRFGGRRAAP
jgi:hypothetical protein